MWHSGSDCSSHVKCYCCSMYKDWYKSLEKFLKILPPLGHVWTARLYKHHAEPFFCCSKFKEKFAIIHSMVFTFLNTDQYSNTFYVCACVFGKFRDIGYASYKEYNYWYHLSGKSYFIGFLLSFCANFNFHWIRKEVVTYLALVTSRFGL